MAGRSSQEPRTVLESLLRAQDRTYEEIAEDFENLGRRLGERGVSISPRHLRRLASGERIGTTPATRRVLQALFGQTIEELLRPLAPGEAASPLNTAGASRSDVELLEMAAEQSRDFTLNKQLVTSAEAIDRLGEEVREIAADFQRTPVPVILGRLVSAQDAVLSSLELRQKPANARQLYFLASLVSGMLAYVGNDVGKPHVGLDHARSGFIWAEYADHNGLRAWIRGIQSHVCYWSGRPREAVRYAQIGAQFAHAETGMSVPWLCASEARAWAALGNAEQATTLLARAAEAHETATPDDLDDFGGPCTFSQSRRLYITARALAVLPELADSAQESAIHAESAYLDQSSPDWDYACLADSRASLALARLSLNELDGAAESLRPVFELAPEQRIQDIVSTVGLVHQALNRFAPDRRGRDLQEEIEIFTRTSLPQFPV